ncbi:MAG: transglycosylase SLT domain-containing protein [Myxococcales bacterium]
MSVHRSVRALQNDLSRMNKAQREVKQDRRELAKDRSELKDGRRELKKDRAALGRERKELRQGRAALGRVIEKRDGALETLGAKKAELEQRYADSFDPADPSRPGDPAIAAQLQALDSRLAEVSARFARRVDAGRQELARDRQQIDGLKKEVASDRKDIKQERREIAQGRRELKEDRADVKRFRHAALRHLRGAELHMSIDRTNRFRRKLGLDPIRTVGGRVGDWIAKAQLVLRRAGVPMSKMDARAIALIIRHESGGNPNAQNNWDSNAAAGTPSIGLMQTIGPTFNAYKLPGHGNIRDPVDNIIAGVRYAVARYGSVSNVPGVRAVRAGRAYVGY